MMRLASLLPSVSSRHAALVAFALLAGGCERRPDRGPVVVSAIAAPEDAPAADEAPLATLPWRTVPTSFPARLLLDATAQGLVRFDAAGQIEPGLAERWTVLDGGGSYIFRLREAYWADGARVTAEQVVRLLRRRMASVTDSPLRPFLTAIDEIVVMTPQVIEIRLARPRPDLLKLFAQPELTLIRPAPARGSGPFRILAGNLATPLLRPAFDPGQADPDDQRAVEPEEDVRLIGESAARAVLRFSRGRSDLVTGGRFTDWPLVALVDLPRTAARLDPAAGLFGLAIARPEGFLADPANRRALSEAIDRSAVTGTVLPGWEPADRILPEALDSGAPPQVPDWSLLTLAERRAAARQRVQAWRQPIRLSVALAAGPGATLLHAALAASLAQIGIGLDRVAADAPADLRLIDAVAPYDSARWYLATACVACGEGARQALEAARLAPTLAERAQRIAEADAAMSADGGFIPIARPLRWSLVARRLSAWQPNARAWHPLNRLRPDAI